MSCKQMVVVKKKNPFLHKNCCTVNCDGFIDLVKGLQLCLLSDLLPCNFDNLSLNNLGNDQFFDFHVLHCNWGKIR